LVHSLFEQAAVIFTNAFLDAYKDLSLSDLGWGNDEESGKSYGKKSRLGK